MITLQNISEGVIENETEGGYEYSFTHCVEAEDRSRLSKTEAGTAIHSCMYAPLEDTLLDIINKYLDYEGSSEIVSDLLSLVESIREGTHRVGREVMLIDPCEPYDDPCDWSDDVKDYIRGYPLDL